MSAGPIHFHQPAGSTEKRRLQKHSDKSVNNALVAKAVEVCAAKHCRRLMYGRVGNHPSLDVFKENNGFTKFLLTRYYVPITQKGRIAIRLGLHKDIKDSLPKQIKNLLIPVYNWISRNKMRLKHGSEILIDQNWLTVASLRGICACFSQTRFNTAKAIMQ